MGAMNILFQTDASGPSENYGEKNLDFYIFVHVHRVDGWHQLLVSKDWVPKAHAKAYGLARLWHQTGSFDVYSPTFEIRLSGRFLSPSVT